SDMIIRGAGIGETIIERSASATSQLRFFSISSGVDVILEGMTIRNGGTTNLSLQRGGAIFNQGHLTTRYIRFENNAAYNEGGAIYNVEGATLYVTDSIFVDNVVNFRGGAIMNRPDTTLVVMNSGFYNNRSEE